MDRRGPFRGHGDPSSSSRAAGKRPLTPAQEVERRRCVRSDAARKRKMHYYTKYGRPIPASLFVRETPAFDARIAAEAEAEAAAEASAAASSSRAPPPPPQRELTPPPPPQRPAGSVVTEDDFFVTDDVSFERLVGVIAQRSVAEDEERRRRDAELNAELNAVFLEQGLAADRRARQKKLEWDLERAAQDGNVVDLVSESSGVSFGDSDDEYDFGDEL